MLNSQVGLAYGRFLELPVAVVLAVLWLVGAVLEGACALVLYLMAYWSVFVLW
jgi:hypothetical protein